MFLRAIQRLSGQKNSLRASRVQADRRLTLEPLEDRRLLSLIGVSPTYPLISYDRSGPLNYNADSQVLSFQLDAQPLQFQLSSTVC